VEAALVRVDGYKSMTASVAAQEATVTYDPGKTNPEALVDAINEHTDFKASVKSDPAAGSEKSGPAAGK
jgi:copper chaperone CopZ